MVQAARCLLIGSIEPYSGKSGTIIGVAYQLQQKGFRVAYGKPVGTRISQTKAGFEEDDVQFMGQIIGLSTPLVRSPLVYLEEETLQKRLQGKDNHDYTQALPEYIQPAQSDIFLLEGAGSLWEGNLFNLSLIQMAQKLEAPILLVIRYTSSLIVDSLLQAQQSLGSRLIGVVINDIPLDHLENTQTLIKPFLEAQGIAVLGMLPRSSLLRSISVREIAHQLEAEILCRSDRLDLMVEGLAIGAMNVNAALEYFRKGRNMAVVTGGDRTDLQLAALETSTNCLILTGHIPPDPLILSRAEDLEVPILSVNLDTLTTVEIVDQAFGKVRLQEQIKVKCIQEMMDRYFDIERLIEKLEIK